MPHRTKKRLREMYDEALAVMQALGDNKEAADSLAALYFRTPHINLGLHWKEYNKFSDEVVMSYFYHVCFDDWRENVTVWSFERAIGEV